MLELSILPKSHPSLQGKEGTVLGCFLRTKIFLECKHGVRVEDVICGTALEEIGYYLGDLGKPILNFKQNIGKNRFEIQKT